MTRIELARSLGPQMVGDLYFVDNAGEQKTPNRLYFAMGVNGAKKGAAYTHYDNALIPVCLCRNGQQLVMPEWSELCATFDGTFIKDFYVE